MCEGKGLFNSPLNLIKAYLYSNPLFPFVRFLLPEMANPIKITSIPAPTTVKMMLSLVIILCIVTTAKVSSSPVENKSSLEQQNLFSSSSTSAKRVARRWTFQQLQEDVPVNGTEALQYDPITEEQQQQQQQPMSFPFKPTESGRISPDKILKSNNNDATIIMNQLTSLKKDFCKTDTIVQRIKEDGCIGRNLVNRYCYGQCNSFYIPDGPKRRRGGGGGGRGGNRRNFNRMRNGVTSSTTSPDYLDDEDLTVAAFKSCPSCRPVKFTWITVTLRCPKLSPPYRKKRIQKIRQCKCIQD